MAEPGPSWGLQTPAPCSTLTSWHSVFCEHNQVRGTLGQVGVRGVGQGIRSRSLRQGEHPGNPATIGERQAGCQQRREAGPGPSDRWGHRRGRGHRAPAPRRAPFPAEMTLSTSRLSLQTETSVTQPQAAVMSPFLFLWTADNCFILSHSGWAGRLRVAPVYVMLGNDQKCACFC